MKQYSDYDDFAEIIRELAREEVKNVLKEEGFCRTMTGQVIATSDGKYSVDLVDTIVNDLLNKTGESIGLGDTVTITEKYGSNYSNCYISTKNASSDAPTLNELLLKIKELTNCISILENK